MLRMIAIVVALVVTVQNSNADSTSAPTNATEDASKLLTQWLGKPLEEYVEEKVSSKLAATERLSIDDKYKPALKITFTNKIYKELLKNLKNATEHDFQPGQKAIVKHELDRLLDELDTPDGQRQLQELIAYFGRQIRELRDLQAELPKEMFPVGPEVHTNGSNMYPVRQ